VAFDRLKSKAASFAWAAVGHTLGVCWPD
jgi:hypothetical protein